ncbi:MAG TPA: ABC-type transport auxiliary lipoprotein family protein [Candidatus Cybelea sp.]|nr:ABC-type transport auxiliary lipoprotein family protein [Candidatus Cybelea sp.]
MISFSRRDLLLVATAGLAGCSIIPNVNKPVTIYTLNPAAAPAPQLPKVTWQLVVAEPSAERDIDTTRIALTRTPNVIEYFADGNWSDTAPKLVQAKLIEAFEGTNAIVAVGPDAAGLKPDYILQSDLRDFQAEYAAGGAGASAHVRLISKLVTMPDRRITRSVAAEASVAAQGKDLQAIVNAFQQALGQVLAKTVSDILSAG